MENIELDLTDDELETIINIYIERNFTKESYSIYKEDKNGFMIAAANALRNEALISLLTEALKNDNMFKT